MKAKSPAFQWYASDFLSDVNVIGMSLAARGAYITLISICWMEGSIPADMGHLARLCGTTKEEMTDLWVMLDPCFKPHPKDEARKIHPRLRKEEKKQSEWRKKCSTGGVRSGESRRKQAKGSSRVVQQPYEVNGNKNPTLLSSSSTTLEEPTNVGSQSARTMAGRVRGKKAGTPLPEGFCLTDEMRDWAREKAPPGIDLEQQTDTFIDHAKSTGRILSDWAAGWRNWIRKARAVIGATANGNNERPSYSDRNVATINTYTDLLGVEPKRTIVSEDFSEGPRSLPAAPDEPDGVDFSGADLGRNPFAYSP